MKFVELTQSEIENLDFACNNFLQSWEMYQRYQQMGRESYFMGVKSADDRILAAGLMLARPWRFDKKIFRVAGGWLMDFGSAAEAGTSGGRSGSRNVSRDTSRDDKQQNYSGILEFLTLKAKEFCQSKGGIALEIAPNIVSQPRDAHNQIVSGPDNLRVKQTLLDLGYKYLGEYEQVKWTFVKDLNIPAEGATTKSAPSGKFPTKKALTGGILAEEMFKAFRTDHRQRIRRAEREGVRVRELSNGELGVLKQIAAEAGERHGFRDPDLDYYRSMKEAFGDKVKFVVAEIPAQKLRNSDSVPGNDSSTQSSENNSSRQDSVGENSNVQTPTEKNPEKYIPLAAAMFVNDGREMVYLYSGSVRQLQKYGGAHLIQWYMIQEALKSGCTKYNFYGVRPVEGDGVYNFKLGFRGRVEELLGTFILPIGPLGKLYVSRLRPHEYGDVH